MLSILSAVLLANAPPAEPLTVTLQTGEKVVLGETLEDAALYTARFNAGEYEAPLAVRIDRALFPEPFEIVKADEAAGTAQVRTTLWGGFKLEQAAEAVTPAVKALPRECSRAYAYLDLDPADAERADPPEVHGANELCPGAVAVEPQRTLILEGLGAEGQRLWVTTAADPRWVHAEAIGANGNFETVFAGQLPESILFAPFKATITPELKRIAWYEVRQDGEIRKLGENLWTPAPQK